MKEKSFVVIGLGAFGSNIALSLSELGHNVMVIDRDEDIINEISQRVTEAYVANITAANVIEDLGIKNADVVIISTGTNLEAAIIATLKCKELGVNKIIVKASSELHGKIFRKIGADQVVIPEKDMGVKLAHSLTSTNLIDLIELSDDYSIIEIAVPKNWVGKSLIELDIRKKYGVNIVAIVNTNNINVNPNPKDIFKVDDDIILIGSKDEIIKIEDLS